MEYKEKKIILTDNTVCILRSPNPEDAPGMLDYFKAVSEESHFMVNYPEEIHLTLEEEQELLKNKIDSPTDIMIAVFLNGKIIGNVSLYQYSDRMKMHHRACFGIAIREKFQGKGLGNILTKEVIAMAKQLDYEQIELGVFADNHKACSLYRKYGFEEWGCVKNAFRLKDGTYRDEITMGLIL